MAGLYSHTTRAAGTVITATIYNGDHQNHIDHQTSDFTNGWSSDTTQMRVTADPYTSQTTESLATAVSDEVVRLRYMIKQVLDYLNGVNGSGSSASATTALGTSIGQWYFGIRNPALRTVGARCYSSGAFAYTTAGFKVVPLDTERYDQDGAASGFHSGSGSKLTIPSNLGGKYHIGAALQWPANASATPRQAQILLNGTTAIAQTGLSVAANSTYDQNPACDYALVATDFVELAVSSGVNLSVTGPNGVATGPELWCHLIGS